MVCTSVLGFYSLPFVRKYLRPQPHRTPIAGLLGNAICILTMSSAIPLQASLLGLTNPTFPVYIVAFSDRFCHPASESCGTPNPYSPALIPPLQLSIPRPLPAPTISSPNQHPNVAPPMLLDPPTHLIDWFNGVTHISNSKWGEDKPIHTSSLIDLFAQTYLGLDARNCDLFMALCYNLGFLVISYWLFKRNLKPLTPLFRLQNQIQLPLPFRVMSRQQSELGFGSNSASQWQKIRSIYILIRPFGYPLPLGCTLCDTLLFCLQIKRFLFNKSLIRVDGKDWYTCHY